MKLTFKLNFIALTIIFSISCKDRKPENDPDPCKQKSFTTAYFTIDENPKNYPLWVPYFSDTLTENNQDKVNLIALQPEGNNTKYKWDTDHGPSGNSIIGFNKTIVGFFPINALQIYIYPVTLKVTTDPDNSCFPDDSGKAVYTRNIIFKPLNEALYLGTFTGRLTGFYNKDIEVSISYPNTLTTNPNVKYHEFYNIDGKNREDLVDMSSWEHSLSAKIGYKEIALDYIFPPSSDTIISKLVILSKGKNNIVMTYNLRSQKDYNFLRTVTFTGLRKAE